MVTGAHTFPGPGPRPAPGRTPRRALRVHAFWPRSEANGPGVRAVVWTQGCTLGCPGCFNPATHPAAGGTLADVGELAARVGALAAAGAIDGLTVSGGEPLEQAAAVADLLERVRAGGDLSVLLFTGFSLAEARERPGAAAVLARVDVLVAGRYLAGRPLGRGLRGSANQRVHHLTDRHDPAEVEATPELELAITADGAVRLTGIAAPLRSSPSSPASRRP